ncbi:endothelin-converting enzyme 1-like [Ixodes scapularis]
MTRAGRPGVHSPNPTTDSSNYSTASEENSSTSSSESETYVAESRQVVTDLAISENPPITNDVLVTKCICSPATLCWEATIFLFAFLLAAAVISTFVWASAPETPSLIVSLLSLGPRSKTSDVDLSSTAEEAADVAIPWGPCVSAACLEQSRIVLRQLNSSVDPCDDFYEHVCRNWIEAHPLKPGQESLSTDDIMEETYGNMLVAAIKDKRTEYAELRFLFRECLSPRPRVYHDLLDLFRESLGVAQLNATWEKYVSSTQLSVILGTANRLLGIDAVFKISKMFFFISWLKMEAMKNGTLIVVQEPSTLLVRTRQDHALQRGSIQYLDPLLAYFRHSFRTDIFAVEQRLANYFRHYGDQDFDGCSSLMVSQLPVMMRIEWLPLLRAVLDEPNLPPSTPVKLASPEYLFGLAVDDALPPPIDLINYVLFRIAALLLPLNEDSKVRANLGSVAYTTFPVMNYAQRQSKVCLRMLNRFEPNLPLLLSKGFSESVLGGRAFIQWLMSLLRQAFRAHVLGLRFFNNALRGRLVTGLDTISWEPLVPAILINQTFLTRHVTQAYPAHIPSVSATFYRWLTLSSRKWSPLLWKESNGKGGFLSSRPRLSYPYRTLEIPPSTFSLNLYNESITGALQIARIGPKIFGELFATIRDWTHVYDQGRRNKRKFLRAFEASRDCVGRDYKRMSWLRKTVVTLINATSRPWQDLWDTMAVPLAFDAFLQYLRKTDTLLRMGARNGDVLDAPRLFFVYYAASLCENATPRFLSWMSDGGVRSPAWYRVNGPLRNMPEFANAFRCRAKSFMNPTRKCPFTGLK